MSLPGYDAWKLAPPPYCDDTSEQEAAEEAWHEEQFMLWAEEQMNGQAA